LTSFFARYVVFGVAHIVVIQAFLNILSNIGLFPFSGLPLPFMSQGGTALFILLSSMGIIVACMTQKSTPQNRVSAR
jgi:cell division protein FtsW